MFFLPQFFTSHFQYKFSYLDNDSAFVKLTCTFPFFASNKTLRVFFLSDYIIFNRNQYSSVHITLLQVLIRCYLDVEVNVELRLNGRLPLFNHSLYYCYYQNKTLLQLYHLATVYFTHH